MVKIITKLYKYYIFDITIAIVFLIIGGIITISPIFSQYFDNNITQKLVGGLLERDDVDLTKFNAEMDKLKENVKFKSINKKVNLSKANLATANLYGTNLTDADLTGADLTNTILLDTNLTNADVSHAKFNGTFFNCASLKTTNITGLTIQNVILLDSNFNPIPNC